MDSKFLAYVIKALATKYDIGIDEVRVKDLEISAGSAKGDGFICVLKAFNGKANIKGQGDITFQLMGKVFPESEEVIKMIKTIGAMEKEVIMYMEILPELSSMIPGEEIAHPKAFFGDVDIGFVMENLIPQGYVLKGKGVGLNTIQVKLVLNELAKLHATSYNFIENIIGLDTFKSKYKGLFTCTGWVAEEDNSMEEMMKGFVAIQTAIIKDVCKDDDVRKRALGFQEKGSEIVNPLVRPVDGGFNVLCHHDCWCNNMMFNEQDEIKLVDWQICRRSRPTTDLGYFLGSSTSPEWRKANLDAMLDFYYEKLGHYLNRVDINIDECYPKQTFLSDVNSTRAFLYYCGLLHAVIQFANPNDENALDMEKLETQPDGLKLYQEAQIKAAKGNPGLCNRIHELCCEAVEHNCI